MKLTMVFFLMFFGLGWVGGVIFTREITPVSVHADVIQPAVTLQCQVVGPCSQYIVQVNSGRGMGRFQVYPVTDAALPTSGAAPYAGNPTSLQFQEPDPRGTSSFTLSLTEP